MIKAQPDSNGDLRGVAQDGFYVDDGGDDCVAIVLPYGQLRLNHEAAKQLAADIKKALKK